ncbi:MAG: MOSC domain-containing protein [Jejuia sp.]
MYIQSVNIAKPKTILWNNKETSTGIYKTPTPKPIFLGKNGVKEDYIADKKVHGGEFKACYLFSSDHYPYWKKLYPTLQWQWGMFGENLTVNGFNETQIMVGDIYKIGEALVQVTQPREPCFKFGVKFGSQNVIKQFIEHGFSGTYVRVLEEGLVETNDKLNLQHRLDKNMSVAQLYNLIFSKEKDKELLYTAITCDAIPQNKRDKFAKLL